MGPQNEQNRKKMQIKFKIRKVNTLKFSSGLGNIKNGLRSSSGDFSGVATGAALSYVSM